MKNYGISKLLFFLSFISILSIVFLTGCSSIKEIQSHPKTTDLKIDGLSSDWKTPAVYFKDENVSLLVSNDNQYFYLCLIAYDRSTAMQILRPGLTLWFDNKGGKEESFGIHFPTGIQNSLGSGYQMENRGDGNYDDLEKKSEDRVADMITESLKEVEILGKDKAISERLSVEQLKGISIGMRNVDHPLVYELKIPLHKDVNNPYAIEADTAKAFSIGIMTGKFNAPSGGRNYSGGEQQPMGGGRRGGGMSGGGRRGGGMGGGNRTANVPKPIEFWIKVKLASNI